MPVQRIVGGIEIQRELRRRCAVGIEEQIDKQRLDGRGIGGNPGIAARLGAAELQPVQRALAGQRRTVAANGRQLARKRRYHRVMAVDPLRGSTVVVVKVLIARRDADNPLHHQCLNRMLGISGIAAVLEAGCQSAGQSKHPLRRSEQQYTSVTGDGPAIKRRNGRASFSTCKLKSLRVTPCRHRGLPLLRGKPLLQKNFRRFRAPMHLIRLRNAG
jgi:hypothetical protein